MGIPSYFAHIVRKHRHIIKQLDLKTPSTIDNLYLDCNSFIYEAHHNLTNKGEISAGAGAGAGTGTGAGADASKLRQYETNIINYVCDSLTRYIQKLKPNKRVFIAFDGVAPIAKLDQQRNRRYMTAFQSSMDNEHKDKDKDKPVNGGFQWNTSSITPGTAFMHELNAVVTKKFVNPEAFGLEAIIVSTSDEYGEGEHKIYEYIRENALYHKKTYTVIYGLDADLIMLTLNHLHISEQMYLFRETPEFIRSLDKTLNPNELYVLDIPLFAKTIINELSRKKERHIETISLKTDVIFDYILMCFFLGNDFLPHFPALNIRSTGINHLMDAYNNVLTVSGETLTKDRTINWKNMRKFVGYLAKNELNYLQEEYFLRDKMQKRTLADEEDKTANKVVFDETLMLPIKERPLENYINPDEAGWETRYYKALFNKRVDDPARKEISTNYLEGLEWTMKYYSSGCADWRWSYHYYYPPLLNDLIKYVPYFSHTFVPDRLANPVSPLVQLSYVLPPSSMYLLPADLKKQLLKAEPSWYCGNYVFLWAFCKFFWEAHVDLPTIDITRLEEIVEN